MPPYGEKRLVVGIANEGSITLAYAASLTGNIEYIDAGYYILG
jgi:hypothetical protein